MLGYVMRAYGDTPEGRDNVIEILSFLPVSDWKIFASLIERRVWRDRIDTEPSDILDKSQNRNDIGR